MVTRNQREKRRAQVATAQAFVEAAERRGSKCLTLPEGLKRVGWKKPQTYVVEFIPYFVGKGNPNQPEGVYYNERTYWAHRTIGAGINAEMYPCLKRTFGKKCPVCLYQDKLSMDPKADEKLIKALYPKTRQLFLVYDLDEKAKGVQLFDVSSFLFGDFLVAKMNRARPSEKQKYMAFYDPDNGFTLHLGARERTMPGSTKPFLEFSDIEFRPREEPIPDEILDHEYCLDDMLIEYQFDELRQLFFGEEVGETDRDGSHEEDQEPDPELEVKPRETARRGVTTKAPEPEPEPSENGDGQEPVNEGYIPSKREYVAFRYRNKDYEGKVIEVQEAKQFARIQSEREEPYNVDFEDIIGPVKDEEPAPKETTGPGSGKKQKAASVSSGDDDGWGDPPSDDPPPFESEKPAKGGRRK